MAPDQVRQYVEPDLDPDCIEYGQENNAELFRGTLVIIYKGDRVTLVVSKCT